jgi:hypothetical protein
MEMPPPLGVTHDAEFYNDDDDVMEGNGTNNVVKELKRFTGLYDLGSKTFSTLLD